MFRLNKRNFSIRSPVKLSSLSPGCSNIQSNSPAKRLKLSGHVPLLSSTFLHDVRPDEEIKLDKLKIDTIKIGTDIDKSTHNQEAIQNEVSVETPPPTPEVKTLTRLELLSKRKSKLIDDGKDLDQEIEAKIQEIVKNSSEIEAIKASRFVYDDYVNIVTLAQKEMRDKMNQIFAPGNEFGQKFETLMKEIHANHEKKFEKKSLELNSYIDQSKSAISRKIEDLTHEIDLHQRTLLHREHFSTKSNSSPEDDAVKKDANEPAQEDVNNSKKTEEGKKIEETKKAEENKRIKENKKIPEAEQKADNDDCIIIETDDIVNEEVINEQSVETIEAKMEQLEDDETDIEDNSSTDEPVRSFTPCQAQRLE